MHIINSVGNTITQQNAEVFINNFVDYDVVTLKEASLLRAATSDKVFGNLEPNIKDIVRANILKNMLINII
jgi:transcriptional regulator CtsR